VDNRPQIPDRTGFIIGEGVSPLPMLMESAQLLQKWGADMICIPCNTAHYFIEEIANALRIPVVDMLSLVRRELSEHYPYDSILGLLATTGSVQSGLFQQYLQGYRLITPSPEIQQNKIREAVYGRRGIKEMGVTIENQHLILEAVEHLMKQQPRAIIAGCTEISMALQDRTLSVPAIDPLDLLAAETVRQAF
jgi:aspartate racemase